MKEFGGEWTQIKMDIVLKYTKAYLQIMKGHPWKIMYFDGFAGSGDIKNPAFFRKGVALQILKINDPIPFDMYYFVELNKRNAAVLEENIKNEFPEKRNVHIVQKDCNKKLYDLARFLKRDGKDYRVLAFIDPFYIIFYWLLIISMR